MPVMDGYTCCRKVREMVMKKQIPELSIIAVTADVTQDNIERCQNHNFDTVLEKPVSRLELKKILDQYM